MELGILFRDVRLFEAEMLLAVDYLEQESQEQCGYSKAGKHHQGCGVVELSRIGDAGIGLVKHLADKEREEPETDVLDPEYQRVS